ncbi:MAG TPA: GAF domain-containing protein [Moraxellaceae bacterium]|nr:GAF domain-containing protein [Moraxellaceae bacterium]
MQSLENVAVCAENEQSLRAALTGGAKQLRRLPPAIEKAFSRHRSAGATVLLRQSIYGLIALYVVVVVPILLFSHDPALKVWEQFGMFPIGIVLALLWASTRLTTLDRHVEALIALSLYLCLAGTLYCSMRLDGQYFGKMAAFETIYILIVTLTILQLTPRLALTGALLAFATSLVCALVNNLRPSLLEIQLYFFVPLMICLVTSYIQENSERRNFVQNLLLNTESRRLAQLHADAEVTMRKQRDATDYLTLISGNHSLRELFLRTQRFLVERTDAQVAASYHLNHRGLLRRVASWALDDATLQLEKKEFDPASTLMGPTLVTGETLHLREVPAGYLKVDVALGSLPSASVLVLPIVLAGKPLAVIELGKIVPFSEEEIERAEAIRTHLAYAVSAANAREIALRAATA